VTADESRRPRDQDRLHRAESAKTKCSRHAIATASGECRTVRKSCSAAPTCASDAGTAKSGFVSSAEAEPNTAARLLERLCFRRIRTAQQVVRAHVKAIRWVQRFLNNSCPSSQQLCVCSRGSVVIVSLAFAGMAPGGAGALERLCRVQGTRCA
jgi:hypothetical protein